MFTKSLRHVLLAKPQQSNVLLSGVLIRIMSTSQYFSSTRVTRSKLMPKDGNHSNVPKAFIKNEHTQTDLESDNRPSLAKKLNAKRAKVEIKTEKSEIDFDAVKKSDSLPDKVTNDCLMKRVCAILF